MNLGELSTGFCNGEAHLAKFYLFYFIGDMRTISFGSGAPSVNWFFLQMAAIKKGALSHPFMYLPLGNYLVLYYFCSKYLLAGFRAKHRLGL